MPASHSTLHRPLCELPLAQTDDHALLKAMTPVLDSLYAEYASADRG
jgi:hypothetical protein